MSRNRVRSAARSRRFWLLVGCLAACTAALSAWRLSVESPHIARSPMEEAFRTLRAEEALVYAPALAQQAEKAQAETVARWRVENERVFFMRDYEAVDSVAETAIGFARSATARARFVKDSLQTRTVIGLTLLRDRVSDLMSQLEQLPHMEALRSQLQEANAHLVTVERRQAEGDLIAGAVALDQASTLLDRAGVTLETVLAEYLDAIPEWRQWAEETIRWSKKNRAVGIVVDKMAHRSFVYRNGRVIATFDVELGPQWIGPKRYEGDLSTPEGKYFVKRKRGPGETIYYLALEIDYPNELDRKRFAQAKREGTIPRGARLGGNIELHGDGGKAFNWTRGCVALSNPDMRTMYDLVSVGTPVTIVGALDHPFKSTTALAVDDSVPPAPAASHPSE